MKNIDDVIRQKTLEIQQLQKQIEVLRLAARLLTDEGEGLPDGYRPSNTATVTGISNAPGNSNRQFP